MPSPDFKNHREHTKRSVSQSQSVMPPVGSKVPYTVSCGSVFRDAVLELADRKGVNTADVARSIILCVSTADLEAVPDPGDATKGDRETYSLKSGDAAGQSWRRKPRLQMRLPTGLTAPTIRRALALALAIDQGQSSLVIADPHDRASATVGEHEPTLQPNPAPIPSKQPDTSHDHNSEEIDRLKATVAALSFDPLSNGVQTRDEALFVLGLPPNKMPSKSVIAARFRMLATIHHPDSPTGSHARMAQLNDATQQTVESLRQSNISIDTLKNAAHELQDGVSRFRIK